MSYTTVIVAYFVLLRVLLMISSKEPKKALFLIWKGKCWFFMPIFIPWLFSQVYISLAYEGMTLIAYKST